MSDIRIRQTYIKIPELWTLRSTQIRQPTFLFWRIWSWNSGNTWGMGI